MSEKSKAPFCSDKKEGLNENFGDWNKDILEAVKILQVLQTKLHEFDHFGTHIVNFKFGVEVVHFLKTLNQSYAYATDEEFTNLLNREHNILINYSKEIVVYLHAYKDTIREWGPEKLRVQCLKDITESEELVKERCATFQAYFNTLIKPKKNVLSMLKINKSLTDIRQVVKKVLTALDHKKQVVVALSFNQLKEFFFEDVDEAHNKLKCQSGNLLMILQDISGLITQFVRKFDVNSKPKVGDVTETVGQGVAPKQIAGQSAIKKSPRQKSVPPSSSSNAIANFCVNNMNDNVKHALVSGLVQMAIRKPQDPAFLENYLKHYMQAEEKKTEKTFFVIDLLNKRERLRKKKHKQELIKAALNTAEAISEELKSE